MTTLAMTYDTLVSSVTTYLKRPGDPDLIAIMPTLIGLAQERIGRELKFLVNRSVASSSFIATSPVIPKPTNTRIVASFNYGTGTGNNTRNILYPRSYEYCRDYWPDDTQTGLPKYYADYDINNWLLVPTPDQAYPFELVYFADPNGLSDENQENWYTQNVPSLLLYATLLETPDYLKRPEWVDMWQKYYDRTMLSYNAEQKSRMSDQTEKRTDGS